MKKFRNIITTILSFSMLFTSTAFVFAEVDELWGVPFLAYGASLSEAELAEIHDIFGLTDLEEGRDFDAIYVDGNDMVYFLGQGNPNANMLSSVLIRHRGAGTGVEVSILTPDYITRVTATQYATAMITAGVTDALVEVAAPSPVTGEAALTGIYKAFSERGVELDEDRMAVAQEQLQLMASIANELEGNENFDPALVDQAVIEIQSELVEHYDDTGTLATPEEIQAIVEEVLAYHNLEDLLTPDQIQRIRGFAANFQLTDAITSAEFRDQLDQMADRVGSLIRDLNINLDNIDRGAIATWWDSVVDWFRNLFN